MTDTGVRSTNITSSSMVDELLGNSTSDGIASTVRVAVDAFAAQLLAQGPINGAFDDVNDKISAAATGYNVSYETLAELNADLNWPANATGRVNGDATVNNRGVYRKNGASGGGTWTRTGPLPGADIATNAATAAEVLAALRTDKAVVPGVIGDLIVSTGDRFADAVIGSAGANGGVVSAVGGRNVLVSIPAGSTGTSSYVTGFIPLSAEDVAQLVGKTIILRAIFQVSAGFLTAKPSSSVLAQVQRTGGNANVGAAVKTVQTGNQLVREVAYTVTADDLRVGACFQISNLGLDNTNAHTLQLIGCSYRLQSAPNQQAGSLADDLLAIQLRRLRALIESEFPSFAYGSLLADATPSVQLFNGAVARAGADGRTLGFTVPAGQTGLNTIVQVNSALDSAKYAGRTVKLTLGCDTSANFDRVFGNIRFQVKIPSGTRNNTITITRNEQVSSQRRIIELTSVLVGDETSLMPYFQFGASAAASADQWLVVTDFQVKIITTPSDVASTMDENLQLLASQLKSSVSTSILNLVLQTTAWAVTKTIKIDGTGDFISPTAALAGITDATAAKRYRLLVYPGTYTDIDWVTKDYIDFVAAAPGVWFKGELADNWPPADIANHQTVRCNTDTLFDGIRITARNMRYPVHSDSSGVLTNRKQRVDNCHIEHFGNQGARDYQTSISGAPGSVWNSEHAWGCGNSSGMVIQGKGSTFKNGPLGGAFYFHTREYFDIASVTELTNCKLTTDALAGGNAVSVQPLGSMREDRFYLNGCEIDGDTLYQPTPWVPTALADQPADHSEIKIFGAGNSPSVFKIIDFGRALKIESADVTNASAVAVSGTAAAALFGREVILKPGSGGLKGYAYGWADVSGTGVGINSGTLITSMGQRLGDCSSVSKTLSVAFQGGAAINIVFNTDMTAISNATILATINAAIGAAGTASLYAIGQRYRPRIRDEEKDLKNTSAVGIPMGSVLAFNGSAHAVRLMTSADAASLFAGVAWEDIYPGTRGRVKTRGYLPIGDLLRTDAVAFAFADTFSVTAGQDGKISKGGTQGLLAAIRADAVRVGGTV